MLPHEDFEDGLMESETPGCCGRSWQSGTRLFFFQDITGEWCYGKTGDVQTSLILNTLNTLNFVEL